MNRLLSVVIAGEVDHGKSSLIGRILEDTEALPKSRIETVKKACLESGKDFEYAYLLDAFQEEQHQGITIDTTQIYFKSESRSYRLIDTPGHNAFLKNMLSGSSVADAAIIVVDAREGVRNQSKRHGYLLGLIGIKEVIVAVNKMDLVDYGEVQFRSIERDFSEHLKACGIEKVIFLPVSAREGENISTKQNKTPWYRGPSFLGALEELSDPTPSFENPLRFSVQDVYKFNDQRIIVGRVDSGQLSKQHPIRVWPSGESLSIATIEQWSAPPKEVAIAGDSIGLTLNVQAFVERGNIISNDFDAPMISTLFDATLFWMATAPIGVESNSTRKLKLRLLTQECECELVSIKRVINATALTEFGNQAHEINQNEVAEVTFRTHTPIALDAFKNVKESGRFVIMDTGHVLGGGVIIHPHSHLPEIEAPPLPPPGLTHSKSRYREHWVRSFTKASSWRIIGFLSTFALVKLFTHSTKAALQVGVLESVLKIGLYFCHERFWERLHFGKTEKEPALLWFTGLPSSGKTTLALALTQELRARGLRVEHLDGDEVRAIFPKTGFSREERQMHLKRVGFLAEKLLSNGIFVIASFISPDQETRDFIRERNKNYLEIFLSTPLKTCEERDVKGLYRKARKNEILNFTGVNAPYERPKNPEIILDTSEQSIEVCINQILSYLKKNFK